MNLVRKGPRYLFFKTVEREKLAEFLINKLRGRNLDFFEALEKAEEGNTIAFIIPAHKKGPGIEDTSYIILIQETPLQVLKTTINEDKTNMFKEVDLGPGHTVMRIPEEGEEVIKQIQEFYGGTSVDLMEGINQGREDNTLISFTDQPLKSNIDSLQLVKKNLLLDKSLQFVYKELRRDAVRYITHGMEKPQWHELKINIYDSSDEYEFQYNRLVLALSDIEAGFILGESWTKDHAVALLSVIAYQVRFFTILPPKQVKRILMGLEYDNEGNRLVDFDLYYNSRKLGWTDAITEDEKVKDRSQLGEICRKKLKIRLSGNTLEEIQELEKKIKNKR
ncbi:MAG: hypothetical protein ACOCQS_02500 [Bacillota bacterium]